MLQFDLLTRGLVYCLLLPVKIVVYML